VTIAELSVPSDWNELTPDWMTTAIGSHHPGAVVDTVTVALRDDGTNRRARLALTYAAGSGPDTVFVKSVDADHRELVRLTSGLFHEPRLFNSGVQLPLEHPTVYTSVIDEGKDDFILVMEDLTARGADPRDATRPLTVDQAANGLRGLARLHARFWGRRSGDDPRLGWLEAFVPWPGMDAAPLPLAYAAIGDAATPEILALTGDRLFNQLWARYIRTLTKAPQTLLHGDPHIGNTYVLPNGDVGFLDWQVARRGNWSLDVGYFLQGALTVEDRRSHERELMHEYRAALDLPTDEKPSAEETWLRYRASVTHGLALWLATASAGEAWQRPDIAVALARRYAIAYTDLDTPAALAAIDP
jgi:Phosphotransferase enzyme family